MINRRTRQGSVVCALAICLALLGLAACGGQATPNPAEIQRLVSQAVDATVAAQPTPEPVVQTVVVRETVEPVIQTVAETVIALLTPLIGACAAMRLDGVDGIGVVVPHRAQRAILRERFPALSVTDSIDTVERFQGGERDVIIVSATASDPDYVLAEADFLLNLNRLNVAISRPRKKLIVVASRSVVQLLTSDLDIFENAVIWKRLYDHYASDTLWQGTFAGVPVSVKGKPA